MNPHRQHYFDANKPSHRPPEPPPYRVTVGEAICILLVVITALGAATSTYIGREDTLLAPVLSQVEQARIEGFRAGVAAAAEQCATPALSHPLAVQ